MRHVSPALVAALAGPVVDWSVRIESWYGGERLSAALPVSGGEGITWSDGPIVSALGYVDVPVGRERRDHRHPVAAYGQRLRPIIDVTTPAGRVESVPLGWFPIEKAPVQDGVAYVELRDMGRIIERGRSVTPRFVSFPPDDPALGPPQPAGEAIGRILNGYVPWVMLDDFGMMSKYTYLLRDRYKWLTEALAAWGALGHFDDSGALVIKRATRRQGSRTPVGSITDGEGGTLVDLQPNVNESAGFNACIAQGIAPDGGPVYGGAFVTEGPMAWPVQVKKTVTSPYGARPGYFYSPLLTTPDECRTAAQTRLASWMDGANGTFTVECGPDPRWQVGDVLELVRDGEPIVGRVKTVTLPLVADSSMRIGGVLL